MKHEPNGLPLQATLAIGALQAGRAREYRLRWRGTKIPRNAAIDGKLITWTQHGVVYGQGSEILGYYNRTIEFGGEEGDEHEIIVATDGELTPGLGQTAELLSPPELLS